MLNEFLINILVLTGTGVRFRRCDQKSFASVRGPVATGNEAKVFVAKRGYLHQINVHIPYVRDSKVDVSELVEVHDRLVVVGLRRREVRVVGREAVEHAADGTREVHETLHYGENEHCDGGLQLPRRARRLLRARDHHVAAAVPVGGQLRADEQRANERDDGVRDEHRDAAVPNPSLLSERINNVTTRIIA